MNDQAAESLIDDLLRDTRRAMVLRAFCELQIPDHLASEAVPVAALAESIGAEPATLSRLMRATEAMGLCSTAGVESYELTPAGALLRSDDPGAAAGWAQLLTAPWMQRAWEQLGAGVRSGRSPFSDVHGVDLWGYLAAHPDEGVAFDGLMTASSTGRASDLRASLDWSQISEVVDVGGGQGQLMSDLLVGLPATRATVYDRPDVIAGGASAPEANERLNWVAGDFFVEVPRGADVYVLSRILHDWSDADAVAILRACRAAMSAGAKLCVLEQVVPDTAGLSAGDRLDLTLKDLLML
ncbi:MAG TPA: methyltransferase, partial [Actinomycetes bacterium]|nr:methyltransferase [Actinomycetes bacterium]